MGMVGTGGMVTSSGGGCVPMTLSAYLCILSNSAKSGMAPAEAKLGCLNTDARDGGAVDEGATGGEAMDW